MSTTINDLPKYKQCSKCKQIKNKLDFGIRKDQKKPAIPKIEQYINYLKT